MCGRFTIDIPSERLVKTFGLAEHPTIHPRYNIAPTQQVPIIRQYADGQNRLDYLHWGLIPAWAKYRAIGSRLINARSETVTEKPAFRQAVQCRRCLVLVSGYYEWRQERKGRQPLYVHLKHDNLMVLAGLWDSWKSSEGEVVDSCTILTTTSNRLTESRRSSWMFIEAREHRMPVILHPDGHQVWLDRDITDPARLERLYYPYPADLMGSWSVSPLINNIKNDSANLICPVGDPFIH